MDDLNERVYRIVSVAVAEMRPSTGCFAKRAERACTRLCPATELAGARVALLRCPILRSSAFIVVEPGCTILAGKRQIPGVWGQRPHENKLFFRIDCSFVAGSGLMAQGFW